MSEVLETAATVASLTTRPGLTTGNNSWTLPVSLVSLAVRKMVVMLGRMKRILTDKSEPTS